MVERQPLSLKKHPLKIEFYGELEAFYTKGHTHDTGDFLTAVREAMSYEGLGESDIGFVLDATMVRYRWLRKRPALPHERVHGYDYWIEEAIPGRHGSFPAMEVYVG